MILEHLAGCGKIMWISRSFCHGIPKGTKYVATNSQKQYKNNQLEKLEAAKAA